MLETYLHFKLVSVTGIEIGLFSATKVTEKAIVHTLIIRILFKIIHNFVVANYDRLKISFSDELFF